jgi:hypothetical protein
MAPDPHPPNGIDVTTPSPARVYDYLLGGKDNYASDRQMAEAYLKHSPQARTLARNNRAFVGRAVRHLAEQGVDQFLDIGSGLPTAENVHQVAQRHIPHARVLYVDNDPMVLAHGQALLAENESTAYLEASVTDVDPILRRAREHLDLDRPVGLLCTSVLHYVPDDADPAGLIRRYLDALPAGSWLVLSHMTLDGADPQAVERAVASWRGRQFPRPTAAIEGMFTGLELVEPGLVDVELWRSEQQTQPPGPLRVLGGVARKP